MALPDAMISHVDADAKSQVRLPLGGSTELALTLLRIGGLGAVLWAATQEESPGLEGAHLAALCLMVVSAVGWLGWLVSRHYHNDQATMAAVLVLGTTGGALGVFAPVAFTSLAISALAAGITFPLRTAARMAVVGAAALVVTALATGAGAGLVASGVLAAAAGLAAGASRRQYVERAQEAEALLAERVRADAEARRAAALAERNRIGREVHDVLAHSLGALAVQLEAAGALLDSPDGDPAEARRLVGQARSLAVDGLRETRAAVHALRDEPVELAEQLAALSAREGAELHVSGTTRPLPAEAGLSLYRATQEALTNARKHAPGSAVAVDLRYDAGETLVTVTNSRPPGAAAGGVGGRIDAGAGGGLAATGGGFGLRGMRERVEQLGGTVVAGPEGAGFMVRVMVPA